MANISNSSGDERNHFKEAVRLKLVKFWSIPGTKLILVLFIPLMLIVGMPFLMMVALIDLVKNARSESESAQSQKDGESVFQIVIAGLAMTSFFIILLLVSGANLLSLITDASLCVRPSRHTAAGCFTFAESPWITSFFAVVYYFMFWVSLYGAPAGLYFAFKSAHGKA